MKILQFMMIIISTMIVACSGGSSTNNQNNTSITLSKLQVITNQNIEPIGVSEQFTALGIYSDNSIVDLTNIVDWSSQNANIVSVSKNGIATTLSTGTTKIQASIANITQYETITVTSATLTSITINAININMPLKVNLQLSIIGTYSDNSHIDITNQTTLTSSATTVANFNNPNQIGLLTSFNPGTTTITATFNNKTTTLNITVTNSILTAITINPNSYTAPIGIFKQFTATGIFSDNSTWNITNLVTWTSNNTKIITINNSGLSQTLNIGNTTLTANYNNIFNSININVIAATIKNLTITGTLTTPLHINQQMTALGTFSNNVTYDLTQSVVWLSSNTDVAIVSNLVNFKGYTYTVATGTTNITATWNQITSNSITFQVTNAKLQTLLISPTNPLLATNNSLQFSALGKFSDNTTQDITNIVNWSSSIPGVAIINNTENSNSGYAIAILSGTTIITANAPLILADTLVTNSTNLTVIQGNLQSIIITPNNPTIANLSSQQFTATGIYPNNVQINITKQVLWSSNNTAVATINNAQPTNGLATSINSGTTIITAIDPYTSIQNTTKLTVTGISLKSITITPNNPSVSVNATLQLTATGTYSDMSQQNITNNVTWVSSAPSIATINSNGLITGVTTGTATISATDPTTSITTNTIVNVSSSLTSITVTPNNSNLGIGLNQTMIATANYSDGSHTDISNIATWNSSSTVTASINSSGTVTAVSYGATNITATYNGISGNTTLNVIAFAYITNATGLNVLACPLNNANGSLGSCTNVINNGSGQFGITYEINTNKIYYIDGFNVYSCTINGSPQLNCVITSANSGGNWILFNPGLFISRGSTTPTIETCGNNPSSILSCSSVGSINGNISGFTTNTNENLYYVTDQLATPHMRVCAANWSTCGGTSFTGIATPNNSDTLGNIYIFSNGIAYIPDTTNGSIYRCAVSNGSFTGCIQATTGLTGPTYITFFQNTYAYITNTGLSQVWYCNYNSSTGALSSCSQTATTGVSFQSPQGIAIH